MPIDVAQAIRETISGNAGERALAFADEWRSWDWVRSVCAAADAAAGTARHVALVARNRPQHVAVMAGNLAARRSTTMIHAAQSAEALARNIRTLPCEAIFADAQDWSEQALGAAMEIGAAAIAIEDREVGVSILQQGSPRGQSGISPDFAFSLLSSGTTGAPKNLPISWATLAAAAGDAATTYAGSDAVAPILMLHPLGGVSGLSYVVPALVRAQPIVMIEKFEAGEWAHAESQYRPIRSALPAAALRMVLDAGIDPTALASLILIAVDGARLEPELHDAFEARYGIPVLAAYGATEFGGVIATWPLADYRHLGKTKRGSCGRAVANVEIRIADDRLGEVPVAAVEMVSGQQASGEELRDWLRGHLLAYQVPAQVIVLDALPRTQSMKVSLAEVRALFAPAGSG